MIIHHLKKVWIDGGDKKKVEWNEMTLASSAWLDSLNDIDWSWIYEIYTIPFHQIPLFFFSSLGGIGKHYCLLIYYYSIHFSNNETKTLLHSIIMLWYPIHFIPPFAGYY